MNETAPPVENKFSRTWFVATGLLALMIMLFALSIWLPNDFPYRELLRAFSEAAMVGAFADWFAVTALFRHPLGIPIPHTAIIPRNKDRIAKSFGTFIERNFLEPNLTRAKLQEIDIATGIARWVNEKEGFEKTIDRLSLLAPLFSDLLLHKNVQKIISDNLRHPISSVELSPFIGKLLKAFCEHPEFKALTNELITLFGELIEEQKGTIRQKVRQESPWFIPDFIDQKIYEKVIEQLRKLIVEMKQSPTHHLRSVLFDKLSLWAEKFINDPTYRAVGEAIREEILSSGAFAGAIGRMMDAFAISLKGESKIFSVMISQIIRGLAGAVNQYDQIRSDINLLCRETVVLVVTHYRSDLSRFFTDIMQSWETKTLIEKIELEIGSDLQFIRINGTLVGGLIGIIIWAIEKSLVH